MSSFTFQLPEKTLHLYSSESDFTFIHEIGDGGFSKVYLVEDKSTKTRYALKKMSFKNLSLLDQENIQKEIEIHKFLHSPFIVQLVDFFQIENIVYLVLEYCEQGNLYQYMYKRTRLPLKEIKKFFLQACEGINYLHSQGIVMRDLKPENCLLNSELNVKLCDFGWATKVTDFEYAQVRAGTLPYMSPESLKGQQQGLKSDIWSLGILLYELVFLKEPFLEITWEKQLKAIESQKLNFERGFIMEDAKRLIEKMVVLDENLRPSIEEVLKEDFLKKDNYIVYVGEVQSNQRDRSIQILKEERESRKQRPPVIQKKYIIHSVLNKEDQPVKYKQEYIQSIQKQPENNLKNNFKILDNQNYKKEENLQNKNNLIKQNQILLNKNEQNQIVEQIPQNLKQQIKKESIGRKLIIEKRATSNIIPNVEERRQKRSESPFKLQINLNNFKGSTTSQYIDNLMNQRNNQISGNVSQPQQESKINFFNQNQNILLKNKIEFFNDQKYKLYKKRSNKKFKRVFTTDYGEQQKLKNNLETKEQNFKNQTYSVKDELIKNNLIKNTIQPTKPPDFSNNFKNPQNFQGIPLKKQINYPNAQQMVEQANQKKQYLNLKNIYPKAEENSLKRDLSNQDLKQNYIQKKQTKSVQKYIYSPQTQVSIENFKKISFFPKSQEFLYSNFTGDFNKINAKIDSQIQNKFLIPQNLNNSIIIRCKVSVEYCHVKNILIKIWISFVSIQNVNKNLEVV